MRCAAAMLQGKLPELPRSDAPLPSYERPTGSPAEPAARPRVTRRLVLLLGLGVGAAAGYRLGSTSAAGAGDRAPTAAGAPRGTLAWALELRDADPERLLAAAGDLERLSMQQRGANELVGVFTRILDLVLERTGPQGDAAGACAVRSLARHGRLDLVRTREPELARLATALPSAHATARALLAAGERRK